jgi:hypothetical protein
MATWIRRSRRLILVLSGGVVFALSGCSTDARDTLLGGLNGAANTLSQGLVDAYFLTLQEDEPTASLGIL